MSKERRQFVFSTAVVAASSLLSRVLGLVRQSLMNAKFGATAGGGVNDCYAAAFKLPDIIYNIIVFGTVSIVLIPYFSNLIKKEQHDRLKDDCSSFVNFFILILSAFLAAGFFSADFFVRNILVRGWTDEANIGLTVIMTRILMLQVLFMMLSGVFGSYLNALEKFVFYSAAMLFYNIGIIFGIIFLTPYFGIAGVAWGAVIGSFMQFFIQFAGSVFNGFRYRFKLPSFNADIRELGLIAAPRISAISFEQFVKFAIMSISSFMIAGSIIIFENTENISMVPFGLIAVSLSTTCFPVFSKLYASSDYQGLSDALSAKLRSLLFFMLPVAALMIVLRADIVNVLLTYGKFNAQDMRLTADSLIFYMIGIPFFSLTIVIVKFYYAQKSSLLPMFVTFIAMTLTAAGCWFFPKYFDIAGLSMGRSMGYIVQAILLILFIKTLFKRYNAPVIIDKKNIKSMIAVFILSLAILAGGLVLDRFINFNIGFNTHLIWDYKFFRVLDQKINPFLDIMTIGLILSAFYLIAGYFLKFPEVQAIAATLKIVKKNNK